MRTFYMYVCLCTSVYVFTRVCIYIYISEAFMLLVLEADKGLWPIIASTKQVTLAQLEARAHEVRAAAAGS